MRVLLTRLSALGDIVHTWPLADALARLRPAVELAWVVEEPLLPLVAGHPAVSRAIPVATRRWRAHPAAAATREGIRAVRRALREFAPEVALDPQGLCKSAAWGWLAGAPERIGVGRRVRRERLAGTFYTRTVSPPDGVAHVVDFNLAMLDAFGAPAPYGAAPDGRFLLAANPRPAVAPGTVAILPGTGRAGKTWPGASYAALARRVAADGRPAVVAWGPGERELAASIVAAAGPGVTLAPPTGIAELAALLAGCAAVVGGDTGPVHLAAAVGAPVVAIFLASDPARNAPRGELVRVIDAAARGGPPSRARRDARREVEVGEVAEVLGDALAAASVPRRPNAPPAASLTATER